MIKKSSPYYQNIPNILSISRIILTFIIIYLVFTNAPILTIVILFALAAITDFFDGHLARRFKWESEFGRKIDIIADRFLWFGTALSLVVSYGLRSELKWEQGIPLLFMMSREIISMPFALVAFYSRKGIPHARLIAKYTTLIQGFALPAIILSIKFPSWAYVSFPLSIAAGITGFISAMHYMNDINKQEKKK